MNATWIVHWPGQDTPACDKHAAQLKGVAQAMGFSVSATPCAEGVVCANCQNEVKKLVESAKT